AALAAPSTVATAFNVKLVSHTLPAVSLAPGGSVSVKENGTVPPAGVYAVDWGDGSPPAVGVITAPSDGPPVFQHTYSGSGSFTEHLVVIQGALQDYQGNVNV